MVATTTKTSSRKGSIDASTVSPGPTPMRKKLHGRAFYESIGSPKFVLAPMVDQSEFVCICIGIW